jgi:hypothetical protein
MYHAFKVKVTEGRAVSSYVEQVTGSSSHHHVMCLCHIQPHWKLSQATSTTFTSSMLSENQGTDQGMTMWASQNPFKDVQLSCQWVQPH